MVRHERWLVSAERAASTRVVLIPVSRQRCKAAAVEAAVLVAVVVAAAAVEVEEAGRDTEDRAEQQVADRGMGCRWVVLAYRALRDGCLAVPCRESYGERHS